MRAARSILISTEVLPFLICPNARLSRNMVPALSCSRISYSPGSIPRGKMNRTRSTFCGRWILFRESSVSSPRVGEKEDRSTLTNNGANRGHRLLGPRRKDTVRSAFPRRSVGGFGQCGCARAACPQRGRRARPETPRLAEARASRNDIRRKCTYSGSKGSNPQYAIPACRQVQNADLDVPSLLSWIDSGIALGLDSGTRSWTVSSREQ